MPLYEYECTTCGERFEVIQKFSDEPIRLHSENGDGECAGTVKKLLSAPAIQFKGTGWYVTDYGKGSEKPRQSEDKPGKETKSDSSSSSKSDSGSKSDSSKNGGASKTSSKSGSSD